MFEEKYISIVKNCIKENQDILDHYNSVQFRTTIILDCIGNN